MLEVSNAHGRCLCGGIRYTVRGELRDVINCHCERCRRFTGHHMAATSAKLDYISIEDADSLLSWFFPVPEAGYAWNRDRHLATVPRSRPSSAATTVFASVPVPPAQRSTIRARTANA